MSNAFVISGPWTTPEFTLTGDSGPPDIVWGRGRRALRPTRHKIRARGYGPLRFPSLREEVGTDFHHVASDSGSHTHVSSPSENPGALEW